MNEPTWDGLWTLDRPKGELALNVYLDAPEPVRTGYDKLDQLLNGGMTRGVTVIGGPSSAGKSVLACQCAALMAAQGRKVVYASYEMSWDVVQLRCASSWSCTPRAKELGVQPFSWSSVVNGSERRSRPAYAGLSRRELSRYLVGNACDPVTYALTMWDEGPGRNLAVVCSDDKVNELTTVMRTLNEKGGPKAVLIVDYIQIVPSSNPKAKDEYERVTDVIKELQAYAIGEDGGNVIAISSTRKLSANDLRNGPSMEWFRGSGYIGYSAEQAVMLVPDREKTEDGMKLSKNADGSMNGHMTVVKNKAGSSDVSVATKLYGWSNLIQ